MAQNLQGGGESRPGGSVGDTGHFFDPRLSHQGIVDLDHVARQNAGGSRQVRETSCRISPLSISARSRKSLARVLARRES
ncbi:MAG: hypothetical protein HQL76_05865 [Magnetococcales bacterium]|nr:hypothetical protein [Magnetococcales bacterium]